MKKNYEEIKSGACIFTIAAKALEAIAVSGISNIEDDKTGEFLAHMTIPSLVLGAFSCEFILKSLVMKNQRAIDSTNKLNELYQKLDEPTKEAIANAVIDKRKNHNTNYSKTNFLADLDSVANIFVDWRNFCEAPHSLNVSFFSELFDELIKYTLPEQSK